MDELQSTLISLPHILIIEIIKHINQNLDKISLTLACKHFYNLKEKILFLNVEKQFYISNFSKVVEKSSKYDHIFRQSMLYKPIIAYGIDVKDYVDYFSQDNWDDLNLETNVNSIWMGKNEVNLKEIPSLLLNRYPGIKHLNLSYFYTNSFTPSSIPKQITHLACYNANQIPKDSNNKEESIVLDFSENVGLDYLKLYDPELNSKIRIGKLPSSLKCLKLKAVSIEIDSLPPNLESLSLYQTKDNDIILKQVNSFPRTLKMVRIKSQWVKYMKDLPVLTQIHLEKESSFKIKDASEFPSSLLHLDFNYNTYELPMNIIPTTVRYLNLGKCRYYLLQQTTPFFTEHHEFDYIGLGIPYDLEIEAHHLPKTRALEARELKSVRDDIEKLTLDKLSEDDELKLPSKLKELVLTSNISRYFNYPFNTLPPSVTTVKFMFVSDYFGESFYLPLPPTVTTLYIEDTGVIRIPTTVNTIYISNKFQMKKIDSSHFLAIVNSQENKSIGIIPFSTISNHTNEYYILPTKLFYGVRRSAFA